MGDARLAKRDCRCSIPQKRWRAKGFQQFKSLIERRLNWQHDDLFADPRCAVTSVGARFTRRF